MNSAFHYPVVSALAIGLLLGGCAGPAPEPAKPAATPTPMVTQLPPSATPNPPTATAATTPGTTATPAKAPIQAPSPAAPDPATSLPAVAMTVDQWLDGGTTVPPDFVPPLDKADIGEKPDEDSAIVYLYDHQRRAGAPGVRIEPLGDPLVAGVTTTNAAGFARLGLRKGSARGAVVKLRVAGNWLPYKAGKPLAIEPAMMKDLILDVSLGRRNKDGVVRLDVFPAVEVELILKEGRMLYTATPVTVSPVKALAVTPLSFAPDDSKANLPRVKVPARPGDTYRVSLPESYIGEAKELTMFTIDDVTRKVVFISNVVTGETRMEHETMDLP